MANPRVSVIIPAYNAEDSIGTTLEQAQTQTYRPLEVIVVDDGSRDGTLDVAQGFPGVRAIRQENAGPSVARNAGIRAATGDFIALLDADDLWMPHKLDRQMALFAAHPELDFVFADAEITRPGPNGSRSFSVFREKGLDAGYFGSGWKVSGAPAKLLKDNFITTSSVVVRKSVFAQHEFNSGRRYAEDWELWLAIAVDGVMGFVDEVLVKKIESGEGLSARRREMLLSRLEVFEAFIATHRDSIELDDGELKALVREQWRWAGYHLERYGDSAAARGCYRKALRLGFDAGTFLRYLRCRIAAPAG